MQIVAPSRFLDGWAAPEERRFLGHCGEAVDEASHKRPTKHEFQGQVLSLPQLWPLTKNLWVEMVAVLES